MNLAEWIEKYNHQNSVFRNESNKTVILCGIISGDYGIEEVYHLSDYVVSSVSGGSIILIPRKEFVFIVVNSAEIPVAVYKTFDGAKNHYKGMNIEFLENVWVIRNDARDRVGYIYKIPFMT